MRYEITVGRSSTAHQSTPGGVPGRFGQRIKTLAIGFLVLCVVVGVLIAAFVVGTVIAGLVLAGLVLTGLVLTVRRFLRRA